MTGLRRRRDTFIAWGVAAIILNGTSVVLWESVAEMKMVDLPWLLIFSLFLSFLSIIIVAVSGLYVVEDLFLITNAGILIKHVGIADEGDNDEDILTAMFAAVQEVLNDSTAQEKKDALERMPYGDKTIFIYKGDCFLMSAFLSGFASEPFYKKMKRFISDVDEQYGTIMMELTNRPLELEQLETMMLALLKGKLLPMPVGKPEKIFAEGWKGSCDEKNDTAVDRQKVDE